MRTKKYDIGKVDKVIGKSCYDVNIEGRVWLVSADVMSKCNVDIEPEPEPEVESDSDSDTDSDDEWPEIDISDSYSDNSDSVSTVGDSDRNQQDNVYVIPQKRQYRTEIEKLHDSLSTGPVVSRTRSGRVNY